MIRRKNSHLVLIDDIPLLSVEPKKCLSGSFIKYNTLCTINKAEEIKNRYYLTSSFKSVVREGVYYFDPYSNFCGKEKSTCKPWLGRNGMRYIDKEHITSRASEKLAPVFNFQFSKILNLD